MSASIPGVRQGLEKSLKARAASYEGSFLTAFAGPVAVIRKLADFLDDPDWPYVNGKFDNVTPAKFLDYCVQLGLVPEQSAQSKAGGGSKSIPALSQLDAWRAKKAQSG